MTNTIETKSLSLVENTLLVLGAGGTRSTALARAITPRAGTVVDEMLGAAAYCKQFKGYKINPLKLINLLNDKLSNLKSGTPAVHHELLSNLFIDLASKYKHVFVSIRRPFDVILSRVQQELGTNISMETIKELPNDLLDKMTGFLSTQYVKPHRDLRKGLDNESLLKKITLVDTTIVGDDLFQGQDGMVNKSGQWLHHSREGTNDELSHNYFYTIFSGFNRIVKMIKGEKLPTFKHSPNSIERGCYFVKHKALSQPGLAVTETGFLDKRNKDIQHLYQQLTHGSTPSHQRFLRVLEEAESVYFSLRKKGQENDVLRTSVHYEHTNNSHMPFMQQAHSN